jgi:hypothetical protein
MEEDKKSIDGIIEKLALITDGIQTLFPDGKTVVVIEIDSKEYKKIQKNFRDVDSVYNQFKIDVSGVEFVFVLEDSLKIKDTTKEEPKRTIWDKLFFRKSSKTSIKN